MASKERWVEFFTEARIPPGAAKQYAKAFDDNRISMDMLMDLNKDYLRDMGITILGDIIAILKHAKQVQAELTTSDNSPLRSSEPSSKNNHKTAASVPTSTAAVGAKSPVSGSEGGNRRRVILSDKELKPSASKPTDQKSRPEAAPLKLPHPVSASSVPTSKTDKVKQRLGPPNAITFGGTSKPTSSTDEQELSTKSSRAADVGGDIFDRLGPAEGRREPAEKKKEIDPWLKEEKRKPPARPKAEDDPWLQEEKNSRSSSPALDTPVTQPSSNRIVINRGSGGGRLSESEIKFGGRQTSERDRGRPGSRRQLDGAANRRGGGGDAPASKKKFVLVTTKPDGSKKQTVLEPDDPRIHELGITKKLMVPPGGLKKSISSSVIDNAPTNRRKVVPPSSKSTSGLMTHSKTTHLNPNHSKFTTMHLKPSLLKRTRITGPHDTESDGRDVMREPRPSVASRLGPKIGGQGHQGGSRASESGPVPRVRSTNDSGEVKVMKRSRITFDSDRNASEVSSAKKRLSSGQGDRRSSSGSYSPSKSGRKRIEWTSEDDGAFGEGSSSKSSNGANIQDRLGPKSRISY